LNKRFLNPEKNLAQIRIVVFEKNAHFNSEKMTSPSRRLGYLNQTVSENLKLTFNLLTVELVIRLA